MVSFFGLKLGGDRKASQKAKGKQQPQRWDRADRGALGDGHPSGHPDYSRQPNFSRPQFPGASSSRPGTADSSNPAHARRMSSWRAVFGNPGMTASMTDLAPPPTGMMGGGGLRHNASEVNLRTNLAGGSSTSLALPAALGGPGVKPGTPSRPATRKSEWVNPLDVHFCKDTSESRSGTAPAPAANAAPKSPLRQFEFGVEPPTKAEEDAEAEAVKTAPTAAADQLQPRKPSVAATHPSPLSEKGPGRAVSPVKPELAPIVTSSAPNPGSLPDAASTLSKADSAATLEVTDMLPSPASSAGKHSLEVPVVRNVALRRDTFTFHQPRRPSAPVVMQYDDEGRRAAARRTQHVEGFSGNFAAFDFGAITPRPSADGSKAKTAIQTAGRAGDADDATRESTIVESRSEGSLWQPQSQGIPASASAPACPPPASPVPVRVPSGAPPIQPAQQQGGLPPAAAGAHPGPLNGPGRARSPPRGFKSRFDADNHSRAPPPRPLRPIQPFASLDRAERSPYGPPPDEGRDLPSERSPYGPPPDEGNYTRGDDTEAPRPLSSRPPCSPFSRPPMEGDFPKSKGLPRGRRLEPPSGPLPPTPSDTSDQHSFSLPSWSGFDRDSPRRSAIPAPLSTGRSNMSLSPAWSSPASMAAPPRLPSPTFSFPSLAKSICSSSEDLARSLELTQLDVDFNYFQDCNDRGPMGSPTLGGFPSLDRTPSADTAGGISPKRVEAKAAPPRPKPVTLPPSPAKEGLARTPVEARFQGGFI